MGIPNIYGSAHYKKMLILPLILVLASLLFIPSIPKGVDLKGGSLFSVYVADAPGAFPEKQAQLRAALLKFSPDVSVRSFENPSGRGFEIEVGANKQLDAAADALAKLKLSDSGLSSEIITLEYMEANEKDAAKLEAQRQKVAGLKAGVVAEANAFLAALPSGVRVSEGAAAAGIAEGEYQKALADNRERMLGKIREVVSVTSYSSKEIGSSLSRFFLSKTTEIILVSLVFAGIVVVIIFRSAVPTLAVLFGAFADVIITAGVMGLLGIPLSLATVATLLMLIGFSIDTDMLLTIRALKRTEGETRERVFEAMGTAMLINTTTIAAFGLLLALGAGLQIDTYREIGAVAVIGGLVDFIATWCGNAVLVLWYSEVKGRN